MGKVKIHEIAKEVGLTSKQIIEKANSLGINVSSHLSSVDEEQAKKIKNSLNVDDGNIAKSKSVDKSSKTEKGKKNKNEKKNETPVIIRREVIISDENKKTDEKPKNNRNDVGFVERNKNKDYNIVYRNKPTKPMTFSELFGIKDSKKEKKENIVDNKREDKLVNKVKSELKDISKDNTMNKVKNNVKDNTINEAKSNIEDKAKDNIVNEVKGSVEDKAKDNIVNEVKGSVEDKVKDNLVNEVKDNIENKVKDNLANKVKGNVEDKEKNKLANETKNEIVGNTIGALKNKQENVVEDENKIKDNVNKVDMKKSTARNDVVEKNNKNEVAKIENVISNKENKINREFNKIPEINDVKYMQNVESSTNNNKVIANTEAFIQRNGNSEKKEKIGVTENKNMEQAVKKENINNNNNGYRRYDNYNQNRNNNHNDRYNSQDGNKNNRENKGFSKNRNNNYNNRNNNYNRNNSNGNNNYNNSNNNRSGYNNQERRNNGENGFNRNSNNNFQKGGFNNRKDFNKNGRRPLDEKGIDKNIKDIISTEITEKESQRDYNSRSIDKVKQNKFEENKGVKKNAKSKKSGRFEDFDGGKLKDLKQVNKLSHMFDEQDGGMLDYYDLTTERGKRNKKKSNRFDEERNKQKIFELKEINIPEKITVKDLAAELKKTSGDVIKKLFGFGIMATINNEVDFDTAFLVAEEFGITAKKKEVVNEEDILFDESEDKAEELEPRPPVVVVMGHVDHGKTSLLDAVRSTNIIEGEAGGITQHIGAYKVNVNGREITFLDTPGHEAFTSMRARGAQITDIAILVVAANDGVMPQTVEAINHAKAANIPIIVAVNKIDLPEANIEKVKQELMQYELVSEEWGGDTIFVPISAKNKINIENLLEMVLLVADMQELKANPNKQSKGVVIEARLDKSKGPIASVLVQRGTLDVGDTVVVGTSIGRIRAMKNDKGQSVKEAGPSTPVEIMGLTEVPEAGDTFYEVKNEKMAKHLIEKRRAKEREKMITSNTVTLSNLFEKMASENLKQLNLIVKADVQGSAEAVKQSLEKLSNSEVNVKVIHSAPGAINESDVQLAKAAGAIIIGFNVRPVSTAKELADRDLVEIKMYSVIYQAIEDVEAAMKGMLDPIFEEKIIGNAQVRQTFKVSSVGTIAGCYVLDGRVERNAGVRIIRDNVVIHEGKLASLKRFKDDAKEVTKGFECGVQIENYNDIKEDDIIEAFVMEEVKR